jgi:hypothetical protein
MPTRIIGIKIVWECDDSHNAVGCASTAVSRQRPAVGGCRARHSRRVPGMPLCFSPFSRDHTVQLPEVDPEALIIRRAPDGARGRRAASLALHRLDPDGWLVQSSTDTNPIQSPAAQRGAGSATLKPPSPKSGSLGPRPGEPCPRDTRLLMGGTFPRVCRERGEPLGHSSTRAAMGTTPTGPSDPEYSLHDYPKR